MSLSFKLPNKFVSIYSKLKPPFGFSGLGEVVYRRTYSRLKEDGTNEEWYETVRRVVEGTYSMQKDWVESHNLGWDEKKAQKSAQEMYDRMFNMKFLPPGRGLWAMGSKITHERGLCSSLNNCAYVTTENIAVDKSKPFCFLMDMSMLGVGVGFDTKGAMKITIHKPDSSNKDTFTIPDTREGWVESLRLLLESYFNKDQREIDFDYSQIRAEGEPIKTFGGKSSGPGPLIKLHENIRKLLDKLINKRITITAIVDIMNMIGAAVVAGNVRRCLHEDSLVLLDNGFKKIKDVKVGDKVITHEGAFRVTNVFDQGKQELLKIEHQFGEILCTRNHRLAVFNSIGDYEFKLAKDISLEDRLVFDSTGYDGTATEMPKWDIVKKYRNNTGLTPEIPNLNEDLAYFIGLFHGDGNAYCDGKSNSGYCSIVINSKDNDIINRAVEGFKLFKINPKIVDLDTYVKIQANCTDLARYFKKHIKAPNKSIRIPDFILKGTRKVRSAYLAGVFDSDGSCNTRPLNLATTVYRVYAEQLRGLYISLGLLPHIKVLPKNLKWKQKYNLCLKGEFNINKFYNEIAIYSSKYRNNNKTNRSNNAFSFETKMAKECTKKFLTNNKNITPNCLSKNTELKVREDILPLPIKNISNMEGEFKTYDLEVKECPQFVVEGVLSHNSAEIAFGDPLDDEFLSLKDPELYSEELLSHRWASNNTVYAKLGMDYHKVALRTSKNGEPGYSWLKNMQDYGRMVDAPNYKDKRAKGGNPCFTGDTLVAVADGRNAVPIKQLAEEGKDVPVYSLNTKTNKVEIKWARNPRLTRKNSELVKVVFDDGSSVRCTPDHKFILMTGEERQAKDLKPGDSVPRLRKSYVKMHKNNPNHYLQVNTDIDNYDSGRVMEHKLIAKFYYPDKYDELYDESKRSGWCKGGLIVHHKNHNGLDNSPDNLEWLTFKEHSSLHAKDRTGEKNPMFGKSHSNSTKEKIGTSSLNRWRDPLFVEKFKSDHNTDRNRKIYSENMKKTRRIQGLLPKDWYLNKERELNNKGVLTTWKDDVLFAHKQCPICNKEMLLNIGEFKSRIFCSTACSNKDPKNIALRKEGANKVFENKQRQTRHEQIMVYKDLQNSLKRDPKKKEWENLCRERKISFRINKNSKNKYALKSFKHLKELAKNYNRRVLRVETLEEKENVYNLTVDDNRNYGIVLDYQSPEEFKSSNKDNKVALSGIIVCNCLEQTLEPYEACCLVEVFPDRCLDLQDFIRTIKFAYLYAKTVTLGKSHWPETNRVMLRNRRIGCSLTGLVQFVNNRGLDTLKTWCESGYREIERLDKIYSEWFCIPESVKKTSVKPSGSVSKLPGATSGIHWPVSRYCKIRVNISKNHEMLKDLIDAGYTAYPSVYSESSMIVEFPVDYGDKMRGEKEVSCWEKISLAAFMQKYWADNQVSATITFDKETEGNQIEPMLNYFQYQLKGVSFLPMGGAYEQMPYEPISKREYQKMVSKLKPIKWTHNTESVPEKFCDGDTCQI